MSAPCAPRPRRCRSRTRASTSSSATPSCTTSPTCSAPSASSPGCCAPAAPSSSAASPRATATRSPRVPKRAALAAAPLWRTAVGAGARRRDRGPVHGDGGDHGLEWEVDVHAFSPGDLDSMLREGGFGSVRIRGEELLANMYGWVLRSLESTAEPDEVPFAVAHLRLPQLPDPAAPRLLAARAATAGVALLQPRPLAREAGLGRRWPRSTRRSSLRWTSSRAGHTRGCGRCTRAARSSRGRSRRPPRRSGALPRRPPLRRGGAGHGAAFERQRQPAPARRRPPRRPRARGEDAPPRRRSTRASRSRSRSSSSTRPRRSSSSPGRACPTPRRASPTRPRSASSSATTPRPARRCRRSCRRSGRRSATRPSKYNSLHAFALVDDAGERRWARFSWVPEAGEERLPEDEIESAAPDYLQTELAERIAAGPVRFAYVATLAGDGDPLEIPPSPGPTTASGSSSAPSSYRADPGREARRRLRLRPDEPHRRHRALRGQDPPGAPPRLLGLDRPAAGGERRVGATCRCARGACTRASNRAGADLPPAPPACGGCGARGSHAAWHPRPSR